MYTKEILNNFIRGILNGFVISMEKENVPIVELKNIQIYELGPYSLGDAFTHRTTYKSKMGCHLFLYAYQYGLEFSQTMCWDKSSYSAMTYDELEVRIKEIIQEIINEENTKCS